MKYKNAKVISHPRAGSHWLAQLLNINFYNLPNYLSLYAGHSSAHITHLKANSTAVFYIYRDTADSVKSMYNLRNRFGLVADSLEEFSNTNLCDMHNVNIKSKAILNIAGIKECITKVGTALSNIMLTPGEYIDIHKCNWLPLNRPNFMLVSYEDLRYDFQGTMHKIGNFLDTPFDFYLKEHSRVGWYDSEEPEKIFT